MAGSADGPNFGIDLDVDESVDEGRQVSVNAAVENTGDAEGTEEITITVANRSTSESVTLAPGESTTVSLEWQTGSGDAGNYTAAATAGGGATDTRTVTVGGEEAPDNSASVEGQVTDATTGDPVAEATVQAGDGEATTDADGRYSIAVGDGTYEVMADADGYEPTSQEVSVTDGSTHTANLVLEESIYEGATGGASSGGGGGGGGSGDSGGSSTPTNGTLEGTVTDNETGDPLVGAAVQIGDAATTTGDGGAYSVSVAGGNYEIAVEADGHQNASKNVSVTAGDSTTADFALDAKSQPDPANFSITDVSANSPTEGEDVVVDATIENTGGQQGTQTVSLEVGPAFIPVSVEEGVPAEGVPGEEVPVEGVIGSDSADLTLNAGATDSVTLSVETSVGDANQYLAHVATANDSGSAPVSLQPAEGTIEGTVTDNETGAAISGATVSADGQQTTTASDGSYSLTVEAGSHTVETDASGFQSSSRSVSVTAGDSTTADFALQETPDDASFTITGVSTNSPVIEGGSLTVDATVENTGSVAGTQTVELSAGTLGSDSQSLSLGAGASDTVSLSLATGTGNAGEYAATVSTDNDTDSADVEVLADPDPANFSVSGVSSNSPVTAGEDLTVDATIENTGDVAGTQTVELSVPGIGATDANSRSIDAGDAATVSLTVATSAGDAGEYAVTVSTDNDSDSTDVEIQAMPDPANFSIDSLSSNSPVTEGEDVTVQATVTNTGDLDGTQTVDLNVGGLGAADTASLTLTAGETGSVSVSASTAEGDTGTYDADVSTDNDSASSQVAVVSNDGTIQGTVTDSDSGSGIAGATVSTAAGDSTTTAADGSYSLTVEAGTYTVGADADSYGNSTKSVSVTAGDSSTADFALAPEQQYTSFTAIGQENGTLVLGNNTGDPIIIPECDGDTPLDSPDDTVEWEDACFTIDGEINGDGTWSADAGDVYFPEISVSEPADATVQMTAPNGFEGEIDPETGTMTATGTFDINVDLGVLGTCETQTALSTTSGSSGDLTGEPIQFDGDNATATLVENEFTVPGFSGPNTCQLVSGSYGLPATTPGENSFELEFLIDFEEN